MTHAHLMSLWHQNWCHFLRLTHFSPQCWDQTSSFIHATKASTLPPVTFNATEHYTLPIKITGTTGVKSSIKKKLKNQVRNFKNIRLNTETWGATNLITNKIIMEETEEMAQWVRAHTNLSEDPSSVLSTKVRQVTTICNSNSRGSNRPF